jgi:hypothetical protein
MLKAVDDGHTLPLSALGFTLSGDLYSITFVLNDNIRLSGRGDSHTMIRGPSFANNRAALKRLTFHNPMAETPVLLF